ncbi:UNVERIFIED_CONTAM: hypothetical protein PYX00_007911 [Menopon gallinae]|uniref:26S proteasome complex subunit SEM1 n=1 Tax=Menopon gallinae TaxID=328185 RepID=A0AAW2HL34_9NEOP
MSEKAKVAPLDLGLLEEDDEFEEFPAEDWTAKDQDDEDISVWEDNWDDDNVEDDFSKQLKIELSKPLSEEKKKRTNAEMAMELRTREAQAQQSQQLVRMEMERKRLYRK